MKIASSSSDLARRGPIDRRTALILALLVLISEGGFLLLSGLYYRVGFPLDDAWIHQTYARNLALHGEWSFLPGQISGGSTAPLWSALLAAGHWMRLGPYIWAYLLGGLALWGLALIGERVIRGIVPAYRPRFPWVGAAVAMEWHLAWSAASGMETLPFTLLVTGVLALALLGSRGYAGMGLLVGLSIWVRPEGITLLGPVLCTLLLQTTSWSRRLKAMANLAIGFGGLFALYLLFNWMVSQHPWPNTFYAKQAEYAAYLQMPFLQRLGGEALQPIIGVGILLLPGIPVVLIASWRARVWQTWFAILWFIGYLALFTWRLPVTYQHGRYVIPAMPILFLLGLAGLLQFVLSSGSKHRWFVQTLWKSATALVLAAFWGRGAYSYGQDVAFIESEMVAAARWIDDHVPESALVAAHDIGALGYFGHRDLVDLAGLVSPEIIPMLDDEGEIAGYLDQRGVGYLVTFPDWYPTLTSDLVPLFVTGGPYGPALGQTNMAVYRWPQP